MKLWTIALHEASRQLRRTGVQATLVVAAGLAILAASLNVRNFQQRHQEFEDAVTIRAADTIDIYGGKISPALRALRPPSVGSIFARGLEQSTPTYWDFAPEGLKESALGTSLIQGGDAGSMVDLENLIRILLGLLAIALGVETIAADRSNGALAALLSQPIGHTTVAMGKLLGGTLTLSLAISVVTLAAAGTTWQFSSELGRTVVQDPLPMLALVSLIYLLTMYAAGMALSALFASHATALTAAVSFWICCALAAPPLAAFGSHLLVVMTPRPVAEAQMTAVFQEKRRQTGLDVGMLYVPVLDQLGLPNNRDSPAWFRERVEPVWRAGATIARAATDAIEKKWMAEMVARRRVTQRLSWLTPSTTYVRAATAVADTGEDSNIRINSAVRQYQHDLSVKLFDDPPRIGASLPDGELRGMNRPIEDRTYALFQPPVRTQHERLLDSRSTLIVLVAYCGFFVTLAVALFPHRVL